MLKLTYVGDANELITNGRFRSRFVRRPTPEASAETIWGGWIGRYYAQTTASRDGQNHTVEPTQER
jgi:hypothetical protein